VLGNHGIGHELVHPFAVLGYHVTGSEGRLFLYGIEDTAAVSRDRDDLLDQRETARAATASALDNGTPGGDSDQAPDDNREGRSHLFGRRLAPRHNAAGAREPLNGQVVEAPTETPAP
jgi:hypothetical protein